ncbi:polysaccharide biosynthesis protein [Symbiobacterium terraclitae]|uniref:polysaccharide biosynthesis protein n=1 Tax=Symbiobacterium terraclitae TaxID=557451 RepID=UPI0035B52547
MGTIHRLGWLLTDAVLLTLAAWFSAALVAQEFPLAMGPKQIWPLVAAGVVYCAAAALLGVYRRLWQYAGLRDAQALLLACLAGGAALLAVPAPLPYTVRALFWLTATAGLCGLRLGVRVIYARAGARRPAGADDGRPTDARGARSARTRRILIIGAGDAGTEVLRELQRHPELGIAAVGFLDDDPAKHGREAYGVPVLGPTEAVGRAVRELGVSEVLIAIPSAPAEALRRIWSQASAQGVPVRILPRLGDLDRSQRLVEQIRSVQLTDLLGRPEVQIDQVAVSRYLTGRTVLVTGAGGSIGSELCRQVAAFGPSRLILFGHGEHSLHQIMLELQSHYPGLALTVAVGDVQDQAAVERVFRRHRPAVVFHAAAHKHVPLMEQNPSEAVKNNVLGTYHVALAAQRHGASHFVLISTDKAVRPTSVMGATKRAAEAITAALAACGPCRMVAVRFGNVLGSRGSVVPVFQQQIAAGGPITVTHPEVTRYFMTIPEAARLVLQAGAMGRSGERFVLDMGEPVRIVDLARTLARIIAPEREIPIIFTGLRAGEKLHEELFDADEVVTPTAHPRIRRAAAELPAGFDLAKALADLMLRADRGEVSVESILAALGEGTRGDDGLHGVDDQPVGATRVAH